MSSSPSLAEELRADQDPRASCRLCAWLNSQNTLVQVEWDAVLADRSYTHASLYRALLKRDVPVGKSSVEGHRSNRHRQHSS